MPARSRHLGLASIVAVATSITRPCLRAPADDLVRNESIAPRWTSPTELEFRIETPEGPMLRRIDATTGELLAIAADAADSHESVLVPMSSTTL